MRRVPVPMVMAVVAVCRICCGQSTTQAESTSTGLLGGLPAAGAAEGSTPIAKGVLGPEYLDGSFGFAVRPLAGARIDRRKRMVEGQTQLAQFVRIEVGWSMSIRLWISKRPIDVVAAKESMQSALIGAYPDLEITSAETVQIGAREAPRLLGVFSDQGQMWVRQEAVIPLRDQDYVLLVLTAPADDRELARSAFGEILESFKIVRSQVQQEQLKEALRRGAELLGRLGAGASKIAAKAFEQPTCLKLTREGKPIGFLEIQELATTLEHSEGLQIHQRAWLFNADASVQYLQEDKFVASDLGYDESRMLCQLMPSPLVDPKQRLVVSVEGGIRRKDRLVIEYNPHLGVADKQSKVIAVEPSYASAAWPLLLPRLVDLSKPEVYAFSMYDPDRHGLILRTFRITGPVQVQVGGRRVSAVRIEDSEGLLPPVSEIDVDEQGRILRMNSGPVEAVQATTAQLEREFGPRVAAAQARFRETAGLPVAGDAKPGSAAPRAAASQPSRSRGNNKPFTSKLRRQNRQPR